MSGRWAQLTYSSFDRMDGRGGGWQVKDTTGDLGPTELEALRSRVQTQLDTGEELPRFPTAAQIAELPHKLLYAPAGTDGAVASWHLAPAGNDASGRPGNVFAHVLLDRGSSPNPSGADRTGGEQGGSARRATARRELDRAAEDRAGHRRSARVAAPDVTRPVERWQSTGWLTPFGAEAVLAAELTSADPPPPGPLNRTTVASWLFTPRQWRMQNLGVLLDALAAAWRGGPPVVLGVGDHDEGAHWIAAASFAMSAGTAREFFFSTRERPGTLTDAWRRGVRLACLGRADLSAVARVRDVVVLDTATLAEQGDLDGSPHRTGRGDEIEVTEWSALVAELFTDPTSMVQAVAEIDEVASRVGDEGLDPVWPVAMVLADRDPAQMPAEAQRVLSRWAPPGLAEHPELAQTVTSALQTQIAGDVRQGWEVLVRTGAADRSADADSADSDSVDTRSAGTDPRTGSGGPGSPDTGAQDLGPGVLAAAAVQGWAELALSDLDWLGEPGPARLPTRAFFSAEPDPDLVASAAKTMIRFSPHAAALPADEQVVEGTAALHLVELALRLGLAHDESLTEQLWQLCTANLLPCLLDREVAPELLQRLAGDHSRAHVAEETRGWIWSQLAATPIDHLGPAGQRLVPGVLEAFGPGPHDPDPVAGWAQWVTEEHHRHGSLTTITIGSLIAELAAHRLPSLLAAQDADQSQDGDEHLDDSPAPGTGRRSATPGRPAEHDARRQEMPTVQLALAWEQLQHTRTTDGGGTGYRPDATRTGDPAGVGDGPAAAYLVWPAWPTEQLEVLLAGFPDLEGEWFWAHLLTADDGAAEQRLWNRLHRSAGASLLAAAAGVRLQLAAADWLAGARPERLDHQLGAFAEVLHRAQRLVERSSGPASFGADAAAPAARTPSGPGSSTISAVPAPAGVTASAGAPAGPESSSTAPGTPGGFATAGFSGGSATSGFSGGSAATPLGSTAGTAGYPSDPASARPGTRESGSASGAGATGSPSSRLTCAPELVRRVTIATMQLALAARASARPDPRWEQTALWAHQALALVEVPTTIVLTAEESTALAGWAEQCRLTTRGLTTLMLTGDPQSPLHQPGDLASWLQSFTTDPGADGAERGDPVVARLLRERLHRDAESRDQVAAEMQQAVRSVPGSADDRALRQAERHLSSWLRQAQSTRSKWGWRR